MTIIAVKDDVMAADSVANAGGRLYPVLVPKIARGPNGIAGATGSTSDCVAFLAWFAAGECGDKPAYTGAGDEEMQAIVLRPDGTLWRYGAKELPFQVTNPYAVGGGYAWSFCEGAMLAGKSAEEAVALTIEHFSTVGGKVQVERLAR